MRNNYLNTPSILKSLCKMKWRIAWLSFLVKREYSRREKLSEYALSKGVMPPYPWDRMSEIEDELFDLMINESSQ